jgi:hypothetical protein
MIENVLILQLVSTLAMTGIIWFVQIVHYPLFGKVGATSFHDYEQSHLHRTTIVVAPLMLTEAITSLVLLWICPATIPLEAVVAGVLLVLLVWASTFFVQVPIHGKLSTTCSGELGTYHWLVGSKCFNLLDVHIDNNSMKTSGSSHMYLARCEPPPNQALRVVIW